MSNKPGQKWDFSIQAFLNNSRESDCIWLKGLMRSKIEEMMITSY